jgi:hypothetical protein
VHSLDYEMMAEVLQQFNYSGEAHASIPAQAAMRSGGQVTLTVRDGRILSCLILNEYGQKVYHDQQAQRLLAKLGRLDWELVPFSSSLLSSPPATPAPTPPAFQAPARQPVQTNYRERGRAPGHPRRRTVPQMQLNAWSMRQRSVYMLCDGTRSSEHIAVLLSRPRDLIEQTLNELRLSGAIEG